MTLKPFAWVDTDPEAWRMENGKVEGGKSDARVCADLAFPVRPLCPWLCGKGMTI